MDALPRLRGAGIEIANARRLGLVLRHSPDILSPAQRHDESAKKVWQALRIVVKWWVSGAGGDLDSSPRNKGNKVS
jgi:hypothetical protein